MKELTPAIDELLRGRSMRAAILATFELADATHRFWSGAGTLTWDGDEFLGVARLGRITGAGETTEIRTTETVYSLAGISDFESLNDFLSSPVRGSIATAWLAFLDEDGHVIEDPILIDQSIIDTASPVFSGDGSAVLNLNATSAVFRWQKPIGRFITHEDQQEDFPGDTGFDRIPTEVASKQVSWTST